VGNYPGLVRPEAGVNKKETGVTGVTIHLEIRIGNMEKINVGIIGLGRISDLHALGYQDNREARIYAVATRSEATGTEKKAAWGAEKYYRDYHDLLADPEVDAVEILTPQKLHEEMVREAAAAKKHIMVQKPMTIDLASADRMLASVKDLDRVYKVIENYIFYPPLRKVKEMIEAGAIGEPVNLRIKFISGSRGGWEIDPRTWEWRMQENIEGRGCRPSTTAIICGAWPGIFWGISIGYPPG
jgi:predicted dehydrogenase